MRESAQRAMTLIHAMADRITAVERSSGAIAESVQRQGAAIEQINHNLLAAAESIAAVAGGMEQLQTDVTENAGASRQVTTNATDVQGRSSVLRREIEYFTLATNEASDWRNFVRYDTDMAVTLRPPDGPPVPGRLRNISRGGAAIGCIADLHRGQACNLEGLLAQPLPATVVHCGGGTVRLQFSQADDVQEPLRLFVTERFAARKAA